MGKILLLTISLMLPISIIAHNWTIEPVDNSGDMYYDCSIVVDSQNYPHIAYCYRQPLGGSTYNYWVKCAQSDGITWEYLPVESITASGLGIPIFKLTKLCIDNQNHPHIAYVKDSVKFKYAYYDGASWQISIIDSVTSLRYSQIPRECIDMVLSESGVPHISYSFINFNDSTRGIQHAFKSGDSWIIQTVWQENRIPTSRLRLPTSAIDLDNAGYPVIAFEILYPSSIDTGYLFCARFNGQTWKIDTVEIRTWMEISYQVFSLKINSPDRTHIFYKYVIWLFHALTEGDSWTIKYIAPIDISKAGGDMILDGDKPKVVYSSMMDPVTYANKVDTLWNYEIIDTIELGLYPSIAQDNRGGIHVSYIRLDPSYLCYARRESPSIAEKGVRSVVESKAQIEIYPNPAKGVIRVRGPFSEKTIKIFDVSGKAIKEIEILRYAQNDGACDTKISLKGIKQGIYFLRVGTTIKKFLVVR